jgi:hypothetical protein
MHTHHHLQIITAVLLNSTWQGWLKATISWAKNKLFSLYYINLSKRRHSYKRSSHENQKGMEETLRYDDPQWWEFMITA